MNWKRGLGCDTDLEVSNSDGFYNHDMGWEDEEWEALGYLDKGYLEIEQMRPRMANQ